MDSSALNYNPLATIDDSSCQYENGGDNGGTTIDNNGVDVGSEFGLNILSSESSESSDNLLSFMSVIETPLGYMFIFAILLMALAMIGLIFSYVRYMIR